MRKLFFTSFFFTSLFVACGDDVTQVVTPSGMETVALGDCSAETLGKMTYVERKGAYVCGDTGWFLLSSRKEKLSCDFESLEDSSGYRMICDGDSVGAIYHGTDGVKGAAGAAARMEHRLAVRLSNRKTGFFSRSATRIRHSFTRRFAVARLLTRR